jgi:hypothetical protein
MSDVIDFYEQRKILRNQIEIVSGEFVDKPRNKKEYLRICKRYLETEDYENILCAILDEEYFEGLEESLQNVVNAYRTYPL